MVVCLSVQWNLWLYMVNGKMVEGFFKTNSLVTNIILLWQTRLKCVGYFDDEYTTPICEICVTSGQNC